MIKILMAGRRKPGMSREEMHHYTLSVHSKLVQTCPGFWQHCNRYVQNHVFAQLDFDTLEELPADQVEYDVFGEFWFDSLEAARAAWKSDDYRRMLRTDEETFTTSEEKFLMLCTTEHLIGGSHPVMGRTTL